ncbi:MAG: ribonuclease HII [Gammaproteobacteria bacterium]|nr:ribonuclease HII [Gammaproteobacteria bacterium]MDH4313560.1 ribonuclease HII [Gammaproteobacteria bacterium]MDH5212629.1 ribonuclease HII [Gammaproteobacteria bacterium]MDH5501442.1 ribonuclease HII [Gammaproteobacteria bacterium]
MIAANLQLATPLLLAGIDEAGRGPLAGPVVAAAVILRDDRPIAGLADSKTLSASRREALYENIRRDALTCAVAWADAEEIDRLNILQATMLAMRRAILGLGCRPGLVEVDGNRLPDLRFGDYRPQGRAVVGGDRKIAAISAASVLAKVSRDRIMRDADRYFPEYGFARHKGYGTAEHRRCIDRLGPCRFHRRTFDPLRSMLAGISGRAEPGVNSR